VRGHSGGYSKMQFQGRNRDVYNSRSIDNSFRTRLSSFTRASHSSGYGRRGITCFFCDGPNHKADGCFASDDEVVQYIAFVAI
jgi:hypothetical protein